MKLSPSWMTIVLVMLAATTMSANVGELHNQDSSSEVDDLPDFNFDQKSQISKFSNDFVYPGDDAVKLDDVEVAAGNDRTNFINRERKIRQVLTAALTNAQMKRKFSEVIPMLRLMTQAQRLTLAALIQAQVAGDQELTLEQVKTFFGDREELILPLILDIANLIKIAGNKAHEPYSENEVTPTYQALRRSFFHAAPFKRPVAEAQKSSNDDDEEEESAAKVVEITKLVNSNQRDDTLSVDEDEVIVKDNNGYIDGDDLDAESSVNTNVHVGGDIRDDSGNTVIDNAPAAGRREGRSFDAVRAERLIQPNYEEKLALSYHERKFNMSAFNATKTHLDQEAMASDHEGIFSVALPDDVSQSNTRNMTMEEFEDLVLSSLEADAASFDDGSDRNQTAESLPTPEQLIAYKRLRPKGKRPPNRKLSPVVSSDDCEVFSGSTICLLVKNYPMDQIMRSIRRHKHAMGALLVDFKHRESHSSSPDYFERSASLTKRQDDVDNNGQMCDSVVRYARPQKARSATGEWKYVVNTGTHTQTLRLEKCSTPEDSCAYLTDNYRSRCIQIYNYHRLLSWDAQRGLHVDIFKVPTCCSCHIDGYKEAFPPLSEYDHYGHLDLEDDGHQSASGSKYRYSTLRDTLKDFDPIEEEEEDFFYSNGYTKRKMKPSSSSSKIKYERPKSPTIEAYLSPPVTSYEPTYSFGARYPSQSKTRSRRPTANRKQHTDQVSAGSDFQPNEVTVLPPRNLNDLRVRLAPSIAATVNSTVNIKLPNADAPKRIINYNYHPIIDFFAKENENKSRERDGVDRIGNVVERQSSWRPMISRRG